MKDNEMIDIEVCPEEQDCGPSEDMPSAIEMAKNLFKDGKNIAKNALSGKSTLTTQEKRDERWAICQGCPLLQNDRCTKCGCFMRVKVAFEATKCPIGKW